MLRANDGCIYKMLKQPNVRKEDTSRRITIREEEKRERNKMLVRNNLGHIL